jgi:hypothetical protein
VICDLYSMTQRRLAPETLSGIAHAPGTVEMIL